MRNISTYRAMILIGDVLRANALLFLFIICICSILLPCAGDAYEGRRTAPSSFRRICMAESDACVINTLSWKVKTADPLPFSPRLVVYEMDG